MRLKPVGEQVVVLFGASSGIGREAALKFAARGARVVVSARSEPGLQSLVEEIRQRGGEATAVPAEVTDVAQVNAVAEEAVRRYGRLDTWVHLAAVSVYATFEETTPEEFERIIAVNLVGQANGARAALPHLARGGGGALIHISSVEAQRALPYQSAYAASKHGLHGFLEVLRMELKHAGLPVSVTEVMPASINTPFFNKARTKLGVKPMGLPPIYSPAMVADAILYAAEHPVREVVVGGAGKMMLWGQRLSPAMMDTVLERIGFQGQRTAEPKSPDAPHNLFAPISGYNRVRGDFEGPTARVTESKAARMAVMGTALGVAALLAGRALKDGR